MAQARTQSHWPASRAFVQSVLDALPQHIAVLDRESRIIATNASWRRFGLDNGLDEEAASCVGMDYLEICRRASGAHAEGASAAADGIRAVAGGRRTTFAMEYPCPSPVDERWFTMSVTRFERAGQTWLAVAHENITRLRIAERSAREAAEQRRLALEAASLGTWYDDLTDGGIFWDARCRSIFGVTSNPARREEALAFIHPEDRAAAEKTLEAALAVDGDGNYEMEKRIVRSDRAIRWISAKGRVLFAEAGGRRRPVRMIGVVADITDRRHAEERQQFLLEELNHRIRNMLATVRSVAASTVRCSASLADFERAFAGRLDAIARTYILLAAGEWRSTSLHALVEQALAPYLTPDAGNATLRGDDLRLPSPMALSLSLILHELATNAAKYGALSAPKGRVEVDWRAEGETERRLVLEWRERGGPAVATPRRRGFGRKVIERSVAYELGGSTELEFTPTGVRCRLEAPIKERTLDASDGVPLKPSN